MKKNIKEEDKVILKMKKEYLETERIENSYKKKIRILSILLCITVALVIFLLDFCYKHNSFGISSNTSPSDKVFEIKEHFKNNWLYSNDYEDLDKELDNNMFHGMTTFKDDPYTTYMSTDEMGSFASSINMRQVGIGIQYRTDYNNYPCVKWVFKDSGAEEAGIQVGDYIVSVNGVDTYNIEDEKLKNMILDEENTKAHIRIKRNDEEIDLDVPRRTFDSTAYAYAKNDYVVLTLSSFGESTAETIDSYLSAYKNYSKLIIDLRNDSGGYQDALLKIAGLFLDNGTLVMKEIDNKGNSVDFKANYNKKYKNFENVVLLVNSNTASAAEVFAICMKEQYPNATIVGQTTYGKGVVQSNIPLSDGSFLKYTTSYWTSPKGVSLKENGIEPDIYVKLHDIYSALEYEFSENTYYQYDSVSSFTSNAQLIFDYLGYDVSRFDGYFDDNFLTLLNSFKVSNGLNADGILDKETYKKITAAFADSDRDDVVVKAIEIIDK